MLKSFAPIALLLGLALLLGGCASVDEKEFKALESRVYKNRAELMKLKKQQDAARRPQADMTADMQAMRREVAMLRGQLEEMQHNLRQMPSASGVRQSMVSSQMKVEERLAKLEAYLGVKKGQKTPKGRAPVIKPPAPAKQGPQTIYNVGKKLYNKKSYGPARDRFQEILKKYPKNRYAASAQYMTGQTYYAQRKYEEAILAYQQVIKRYPRSSLVPAAMLKQGMAFRAIGDKRTAKIVLRKLTKSYPKSVQAKTAKKILRKLK